MKKKLSMKHEAFAKSLIRNKGNITKAYQETYPDSNPNSAGVNGSILLKNHSEIKARVFQLFSAQNKIDRYVQNFDELSEANKKIYHPAEKRFFDVPDNATRLESLKAIFKILGLIDSGISQAIDARSVTFNVDARSSEQLAVIAEDLKRLNDSLLNESPELEEPKRYPRS